MTDSNRKRFRQQLLDKTERNIQRKLIRKNLRDKEIVITEEEVEFFKENPEELEDMTSTLTAKKLYLTLATLLGLFLVAFSILFRFYPLINDGMIHSFIIDLAFEGGVALWGAAITVYLLEIVLEKQHEINSSYRREVLKRIKEKSGN